MNENLPPIDPESQNPPTLPPKFETPRTTPHFGAMFALGVVLIIISTLLCIALGPVPFLIGAVAAFVTLFFKGYRGVFVGYISTLGLILLGTIIYCANTPFDMK